MSLPSIPLSEYAARRKKALTALKKSVGIIFAGDHDPHLSDSYRPHPHFTYLTGVMDETEGGGAALVLDPTSPVEARQSMLFLRPLNPEIEKWDGYRLEVSAALRERTGFKAVYRTTHLPRFLTEAAQRAKSLACLHPLAPFDQPISPDLALFRKIADRMPECEIVDRTDILAKLRSVKSKHELAMMQQAIDITAAGFETVMKSIKPGQNEADVQATLEHAYRTFAIKGRTIGSRNPAFGSIVGSGINSTVLHYRANEKVIADGDMVCIDSGASFGAYGADITRTIPANGKFSARQAEIYNIVLKALEQATNAVKPGATFAEIDAVARAVITKAGYGDQFIHSIGHHLGLETHDITPDGPLKVGAVVTIEPGIYIPEEAIGVRIEDDVLVTKDGRRNLSQKIPRTISAIEKLMNA